MLHSVHVCVLVLCVCVTLPIDSGHPNTQTHRVEHTVGKCNPLPFVVCLCSRCLQTASIGINELRNKDNEWAGISIRLAVFYGHKLKVG